MMGSEVTHAVDLAVVIVSHNAGSDILGRAVASVGRAAGTCSLRLAIVDNGTDGAGAAVAAADPDLLVMKTMNDGYAAANNRAIKALLRSVEPRYVLFLNPDVTIAEGRLDQLVAAVDRSPRTGAASVTQLTMDGGTWPTMKRYPSVARALAEAVGLPRVLPGMVGGDTDRRADYSREQDCDWLPGSFLLVRWDALGQAGGLDERFFLFSEDTDLCRRLTERGWRVKHLPMMRVIHLGGEYGTDPARERLLMSSRILYAEKHMRRPAAWAYRGALALHYAIRAIRSMWPRSRRSRLDAQLAALTAALAPTRTGRDATSMGG